eukprot:m.26374 g.26374  ORF g.26374 m.26374 type:complete len:609 (+) comp11734_c0_seq1:221-2047(+)
MFQQVLLLAVAVAGSVAYILVSQIKYFLKVLHPKLRESREVEKSMTEAPDYEAWYEKAYELDALQGNDRWKRDASSRFYDHVGLQARLSELKDARRGGMETPPTPRSRLSTIQISKNAAPRTVTPLNWDDRMDIIRENMDRNICGIGEPWLYNHATIGTKELIEDYVTELALQVEKDLLEVPDAVVPRAKMLRFLLDSRQAFGRTALVMTGGMTLGLFHMGVVKCLYEQNCLPPVICGTSIGALLAGMLGVCTDDELPSIWSPGGRVKFEDFSEPNLARRSQRPAWARKVTRLLKNGVFNDINKLGEWCRKNIGDLTFKEAFDRTGRIINITVPTYRVTGFRGAATLLNYITAPNVVIWSAACASCEYPGLYSRFELRYKELDGTIKLVRRESKHEAHGGQRGSLHRQQDLPMERLSELFNVNHFVVSQVHPHMVPFLRTQKSRSRRTLLHKAFVLLCQETWHWISMFAENVWEPSFFTWIREEVAYMSVGDVVIVPRLSLKNIALLFQNPNQEVYEYCVREAERSTYPQVLPIQMRCRVEKALHKAVWQLRGEVRDMGVIRAYSDRKLLERPATPMRPSKSTPTPTSTPTPPPRSSLNNLARPPRSN